MVALLLACACGLPEQSSPGARADGPADKASPALNGFDPVLLVAGKEVKGKPAISLTRGGFRYLFVDAANKVKFEKDPQRYEIQCQGHCALHPGTPANPDLFTVHKGRIYCFACEDCREAFRQAPEKNLERRSVVILVFEGMELLDFAGPAEVFLSAGFRVHTVAATRDPVPCAGLVTLTPSYTLANCPPADVIVIPGGRTAVSRDKRVTDWVVQASRQAKATLSVCTGVFVLARAGLLDGKEATTHHGSSCCASSSRKSPCMPTGESSITASS
jgi:YHS domain-containing protein